MDGSLMLFWKWIFKMIIKLQTDIEDYCSRCPRLVDIWSWKYKNGGNEHVTKVVYCMNNPSWEKSHWNDTLQVFLQKYMTSRLTLPTIIMTFKVFQQLFFFKRFFIFISSSKTYKCDNGTRTSFLIWQPNWSMSP